MVNKYQLFFNTFKNPTKSKIISLLMINKKMTVTQMSKYIETTKSNIYQNISDLVMGNIVNEPEIKINKNYIEKFYSVNKDFFDFKNEIMNKEITKMNIKDFRELIKSFFMAQYLNLKVISDYINDLSDEELRKIQRDENKNLITSYGTLSNNSSHKFSETINSLLNNCDSDDEEDTNMYLFLIFPLIKGLI